MKNETGITLIALIITIIILVILAAISINAVYNMGIVGIASNGVQDYSSKALEENETLLQTADLIDNALIDLDEIENPKQIDIGTYIEYNVEYIDMYTYVNEDNTGLLFTKYNGWRYLGQDTNGNNLIVSTGIPVILYHNGNYSSASWWGTEAEAGSSASKDKAVYGLKNFNKFKTIPFTYKGTGTSADTENTGIFRMVKGITATENNTTPTLPENAFIADGVTGATVHALSLDELMNANGGTATNYRNMTGVANGLFEITDLDEYNGNYQYWLATPYNVAAYSGHLYRLTYSSDNVSSNTNAGLRIVVVLPSSYKLKTVSN